MRNRYLQFADLWYDSVTGIPPVMEDTMSNQVDWIAAKLQAKQALERAERTLAQTLAMIDNANAAGLLAVLGKYQKQASRQRDAVVMARMVYDELNAAAAPSVDSPKGKK